MNNTDQEYVIVNANISNKSNLNNHNITGAIFLVGVTSIFFLSGFSSSLAVVKKNSPKLFNKGMNKDKNRNNDTGTDLALRALKWGSFYSIIGCSAFFLGIWKLSGVKTFEEFRYKMRKMLPKITKDPSRENSVN